MKQLKLQNLVLTNFKGIKHFELNAAGDVQVYGDNATGKTTLFDAFVWLMFDKDSQNQKDFSIKTLVGGKTVHNLNHEVEATLLIDGVQLALKSHFPRSGPRNVVLFQRNLPVTQQIIQLMVFRQRKKNLPRE